MPPVFSSTPISTRDAAHHHDHAPRHALHRRRLVGDAISTRIDAASERRQADVELEARPRRRSTRRSPPPSASGALEPRRGGRRAASGGTRGSRQPPSDDIGRRRHQQRAPRSWRPRPSPRGRRCRPRPSCVLAMMPMALIGERLPALAPLPPPARSGSAARRRASPTAIAIGISSATAMIAPGPTDDSAKASANSSTGSSAGLPAARAHRALRQRAPACRWSRPARTAASRRSG